MHFEEPTTQDQHINYVATSTPQAFHSSDKEIRLLMGPVGTGKSVASMMDIWKRAIEQPPCKDGIRRSKFAIIRNTYPDLMSTTLATWLVWFPEEFYGKVRRDSPITQTIRVLDVELIVLFLACDNPKDVKKLKSLECTGIYFNEIQYIDKTLFDEALGRINRYPPKIYEAPLGWSGIIADANPPSTRHWLYRLFEVAKPTNAQVFKFPPALKEVSEPPTDVRYEISLDGTIYINNPDADYIRVQRDPDYWVKQVPALRDEQIKVNHQGEYGFTKQGKPIHPEYRDSLHFAKRTLKCSPHLPIGMGWDFGNTPAVAIGQLTARGQLQIIHEFYCDDSSLEPFAENVVVPFLDKTYPWWRDKDRHHSFHDPAGSDGSQGDGVSCEQILRKHGIRSVRAASSNAPTARRNGIKYFMQKLINGDPAFLLSDSIELLREGLMGGYCYARINNTSPDETKYHDKPLKNMYSHITEAAEYLAMNYCLDVQRPKKEPAPFVRVQREFA